MSLIFEKEEDNMKKKLLIVATVCASLFVVAPAVSVSAAEVGVSQSLCKPPN